MKNRKLGIHECIIFPKGNDAVGGVIIKMDEDTYTVLGGTIPLNGKTPMQEYVINKDIELNHIQKWDKFNHLSVALEALESI